MRDGGGARLPRDGGRGLRRGGRVPLRPPPARRHAVRRAQRDGDRGRRGRARRRAARSSSSPPPTTARAGTAATSRPRRASAASATRTSRRSSRASTPCGRGRRTAPASRVGVAAHSIRAVPASWLEAIAAYAERAGLVRHVHAHEQPREVAECRAEHGCSPAALLDRTGFLGPRTSVVHGIHVTRGRHRACSPASDTIVVSCPTTEGSLGDGSPPALAYRDAGVRLAVGTDSQVRIDPFEETRELETLARRERRHATRAARRLRRPVGRAVPQRPGEPRARRADDAAGVVAVDRDHPELPGSPTRTSRSPSRRARRRPSSAGPRRPRRGVHEPARRAARPPAASRRPPSRAHAPRRRGLRPAQRRGGRAPARRPARGGHRARARAPARRRRPRDAALGPRRRARHHVPERARA